MASCERFTKDVSDTRRIIIDWSEWLGSGVSISTSAWTVPSGLTEGTASSTSTTATHYLSGGTDGQEYEVKNTITTDESPARIKSVSFHLAVESNC